MEKNDIFMLIKEKISIVMNDIDENKIKPSASLKELGLNSIDRAEIILLTLETLQLKSSLVDFAMAKNIGELCDMIKNKNDEP
ncbi:MAG: acyl carrier protein [Gammaproteobacteria bacterium]|nr:acyl carrier protein [Gammaproteobacteria bacterium]MCW5583719.1 acyl carrier protein [Gammaproteobacteria bacterium]